MLLYTDLQQYIENLVSEFDLISDSRKDLLVRLGSYIRQRRLEGLPVRLNVICTHNSRRSHIGQLWLQAAARFYNTSQVYTFSGGTEATAFHPNAVAAMRSAGFRLEQTSFGTNPRYLATIHPDDEGLLLFSKRYDEAPNPRSDFAAILVCTAADKGCPVILGANQRFAIPYEDPKVFDGTDRQAAAYAERCREIGRELLFAMSLSVS